MADDVATPNHLRLITEKDVEAMRSLAREMRTDLQRMGDVISEEVLTKERMLAMVVTRLLQQSSDPNITLEEAVKVLTVAAKLHAEWTAGVAPIARKLGEDIRRMKKQLAERGGGRVGAPLQLGPTGGSGNGSPGGGRGGQGEPGHRPQRPEKGTPR